MDYTIKHVCQELGLTVHAVRFYCDKGLVPGLRHDRNGNRIFDEASLNWLRAVTFLRASGMSVAQIKDYFGLCLAGSSTLPERRAILAGLRETAVRERDEAQARIDCLDRRIESCSQAMEGTGPDDCNPLNW